MQFWDNLGCFWTHWEPHTAKKISLAGNFKLSPIVEVCTVLKDVLAKTPKIIPRNNKKEHFWSILGYFRAQSNSKKSFEGTIMDFRMLFRSNLWKMSQQIGVSLNIKQFWDNFGCFWTPWEPHPAKKIFFDPL